MILPLKTFMVKQNLHSWFLDTSPPSPQVVSFLNKATYQHLSLEYWLSSSEQPNLSSVNRCRHAWGLPGSNWARAHMLQSCTCFATLHKQKCKPGCSQNGSRKVRDRQMIHKRTPNMRRREIWRHQRHMLSTLLLSPFGLKRNGMDTNSKYWLCSTLI